MADGRRGAGARAGSSARRAAALAVLAALAVVCLGADVARAARSRRMEAAALQVQVLGGAGAVPDVAAALAANGAAVAGGADQDTVIRVSTPVRELENAGGFEKRSLNDDMVRHIDAAGASTESEPTNNGTSLCGGLVCPYLSGVCCPGTTHCCMEGYICSGGYPPTCLDARVDDEQTQSQPTRTRIVSVSVTRPNGQTTTTQLSPPPAPAASSQAPAAPVNSAPAPAVGPAPLPPGILTLQNVQPPTTLTVGIQNLENGPAWPPMAAYAPDGTPRAYVQADQRDWLGGGLQRNGTYNMVVNETLCQQQCDALEECAVYRYVRTNGECWLDTAVSPTPGPCPVVSGVRNCVSGVRRADDRVVAAYPYPDPSAVTLGDWYAVEQRNWLPSSAQLAQQGGRLIRQGKQNIVATPAECVKQCADLKYCAVAMFMRSTGECWLSSRLAPRSSGGSPCALRGSVRDCASYVRRKKDERDPKNAAPVDAWAPGASAAAQSAALAQVSRLGAAVTQATASLPSNSGTVSVAIPLPRV